MSRAFVRESDFGDLPEIPPPASPLPPGARNYMTAGGVARLRRELAHRLEHERPRLAAAPADDVDAKRDLQALDQRIRYLQEGLRTAEVAPVPPASDEVVHFGATATVRDDSGEQTRYRIVGVDETDLDRNWVSWVSPIARALLNARVGQRVVFKLPRGQKELEIVAVAYEVEA